MAKPPSSVPRDAADAAADAKVTVRIEWWPIDKPIPYAKNPRKISDAAVDLVARSIQEFGWRQPIVVDTKGVIVAGHTRLAAAKKLGLQQVPVHVASDPVMFKLLLWCAALAAALIAGSLIWVSRVAWW